MLFGGFLGGKSKLVWQVWAVFGVGCGRVAALTWQPWRRLEDKFALLFTCTCGSCVVSLCLFLMHQDLHKDNFKTFSIICSQTCWVIPATSESYLSELVDSWRPVMVPVPVRSLCTVSLGACHEQYTAEPPLASLHYPKHSPTPHCASLLLTMCWWYLTVVCM